jgi:hypothetical protein
MVKGFACLNDGVIDIRTVQNTEIGAMVNGLVLHAGYTPLRSTTDDMIRKLFNKLCEVPFGLVIVPVVVIVNTN